ncbi:hypothetical protein HDV06_001319 [Boothiomyces sp. JEL0866]|nr:hypothetical protein HDV06_001319 [Boothiomyces sp. JEL0866]
MEKENLEFINPYFMASPLGLDIIVSQLKHGNEFLPALLNEYLRVNPLSEIMQQCLNSNGNIKYKITTEKLFNIICTIPEVLEYDMKNIFYDLFDGICKYEELGALINKLCTRGFSNQITMVFKERLDSESKFVNMRKVFRVVNQRTVEQLFFNFLLLIDQDESITSSESISSYIESLADDLSMFRELLNMKAISSLSLSNCMVDALVITCEKINQTHKLFDRLIDLWCSKAFVKSASFEYHVKVTIAILSCFRILKKVPSLKVSQAIPNYLEETRENVKMMGMNLGEVLLNDQQIKLEFGFTKPDFFNVLEKPMVKNMSDFPKPPAKQLKKNLIKSQNGESILSLRKLNESKKHLFKSEPSFIESGELKLQIKKKDKSPKFLFDAIKLLKSNDPEEVLVSIKVVESLIEKASEKEINDNSAKLAELLLHIENQFGTQEFEDAKMKSLVTLCIRNLENTTSVLVKDLFIQNGIALKITICRILTSVILIMRKMELIEHKVYARNYDGIFSEPSVGEAVFNCLTICVGLGEDQILTDELALVVLSVKSGYEKERLQAIQICRNSQMWEILVEVAKKIQAEPIETSPEIISPSEEVDILLSTLEDAEPGIEELHSWEDLHQQAFDIQQMYPSAPVGPIFEDPAIEYPSIPLMTMDVPENDILYPSAPIFDEFIDLQPTAPMVIPDPIPATTLEQIYVNPIMTSYKEFVNDFRVSMNAGNNDDDFYRRIRNYRVSLSEIEQIKSQISVLQMKTKNCTSRLWTLSQTPVQIKQTCPDSWTVHHVYMNETANYNQNVESELKQMQLQLKRSCYINLVEALHKSKVEYTWIRNHIDEALDGEFGSYINSIQNSRNYETLQANCLVQQEEIMHMIDVLFVFERAQDMSASKDFASSNKETSLEDTKAGIEGKSPDKEISNEFIPSNFKIVVREWIILLATSIYLTGQYFHHRHLLLHYLRTPGINAWGSILLQYPVQIHFSESFMDHYLVCISALLGPIEEIEELLAPKLLQQEMIAQDMKKLENDLWIVVDEEFKKQSINMPKTIILSEDDYLALIRQFNIVGQFNHFVSHFFSLAANSNSVGMGNLVMKGFAVAHNIFSILTRSFFVIPQEFEVVRGNIADILIVLNYTLAEMPIFGEDQNIYFTVNNGLQNTSLVQELDQFIFRSIKSLLSKEAIGLEKKVIQLPIKYLSENGKYFIINSILTGAVFDSSLGYNVSQTSPNSFTSYESLLVALIRESDSIILDILQLLLFNLQSLDISIGQSIINACFSVCFCNKDLQSNLFEKSNSIVTIVCRKVPGLIGYTLKKVRDNFSVLESISLQIYKSHPCEIWAPNSSDVQVLENLLKDPINSSKSNLARYIIDKIDWERNEDILPECHRQIGLAITNIYLDHIGRPSPQSRVYTASNAIIQTAISAIKSSSEETFSEWCWKSIQRLQIYIKPYSGNTYMLSEATQFVKPFEGWESSIMATIRAHSQTEALAAYSLLLVSEVGHRLDLFEAGGWQLLNSLVDKGHYAPFIKASYQTFQTVLRLSNGILNTSNAKKLFTKFWNSSVPAVEKSWILDYLPKTLNEAEQDSRYSPSTLWCSFVFCNSSWRTNSFALQIMDVLSKNCIAMNCPDDLLTLLNIQYKNLIFSGQANNSLGKDYQLTRVRPIDTLYRFAANQIYQKFGASYLTFPSLIMELNNSVISELVKSDKTPASDPLYYMFIAISVETFAEKEVRSRIGNLLNAGSSWASIKSTSDKPLQEYCIFKIFELLDKYQFVDHPIAPLMWQLFFSLYFEKSTENGVCFGYKFLELIDDSTKLVIQKLDTQKSNSIWGEVANCMQKWIADIQLVKTQSRITREDYMPSYLNSLIENQLFEVGRQAWWTNLVIANEPVMESNSPHVTLVEKELVKLEVPKPLQQIKIQKPLISNEDYGSIDSVMEAIQVELSALKKQAMHHSSIIQRHNDLDEEFLKNVPHLHRQVSSPSSTFKKCSKTCPGVTLNFERQSSVLDSEISKKLSQIRIKMEMLINSEIVNQRTAICSIKITKLVDWIVSTAQSEAIRQKAVGLFYECFNLLDMKYQAFPPADSLITLMIDSLGNLHFMVGSKYIAGSGVETPNIFERLKSEKHIEILSKYFSPHFSGREDFVNNYDWISGKFKAEQVKIILDRFDVKLWNQIHRPMMQSVLRFLKLIIKYSTENQEDEIALQAHLQLFRSLISCQQEEKLYQCISMVLESIFSGSPVILLRSEFLTPFFPLQSNSNFMESWSQTVIVPIYGETVFAILKQVISTMKEQLYQNTQNYSQVVQGNLDNFLKLVSILYSANTVYSHSNSLLLFEMWEYLSAFTLLLLCVDHSSISSLDNYTVKDISEILRMYTFTTQKVCHLSGSSSLIPSYIWKAHSKIISVKSKLCTDLFYGTIVDVKWDNFDFNQNCFEEISIWRTNSGLETSTVKFLVDVIISSELNVEGDSKRDFYEKICKIGNYKLSLSDIREISGTLPKKWFDQIESIAMKDKLYPLILNNSFFLKMVNECPESIAFEARKSYIDYNLLLFRDQTKTDVIRDPLAVQNKAFNESKLGDILIEFILQVENEWDMSTMEYLLQNVFTLLNEADTAGKAYTRIAAGINSAIASPEQMALVCETSISSYIKSRSALWQAVEETLIVPELEESIFIRHCLSHCLVFTLYVYSLQKLQKASNNPELKIMIGEQIGVWIESLKVESIHQGQESKLLLMILQFARLLKFEYSRDINDRQSRLFVHLPPIADALFKWSDSASAINTLWTAFGFGKSSILPTDMRFICKVAANFIAIRRLRKDQTTESTKMVENFKTYLASPDFKGYGETFLARVESIVLDESVHVSQLEDTVLTLTQKIYPELKI